MKKQKPSDRLLNSRARHNRQKRLDKKLADKMGGASFSLAWEKS